MSDLHVTAVCPSCGYDPTGDDEEFVSGGGWLYDNHISDGIWTDQLRCPQCHTVVDEDEQRLGDHWRAV